MWVIAGDFNLILNASDKNSGNINRRNIRRFRRFVNDMQLKDVYLHGRRYTWSNERETPTLARLDRVLVSTDWDAHYSFAFLQALSSGASDHCPLHLATNAYFPSKRQFHFEPWWIALLGFSETVAGAWSSTCPSTDPFVRLDHKLKCTAKSLQRWSSKKVGQIRAQLLVAKAVVLWLDKAQELRTLTAEERSLRTRLKYKTLGLSSLERNMKGLREWILLPWASRQLTCITSMPPSPKTRSGVPSKSFPLSVPRARMGSRPNFIRRPGRLSSVTSLLVSMRSSDELAPGRLNTALITLVPKKWDAASLADYRPISLVHNFAKLVAKLLSNRLAPELHRLVDVNQSAFIKTRSIHDNFKFVELAAKSLHRKRKPNLLIKLDISKAFDTVSWPFLLQVLQACGFGGKWREWIAILVSTASTRVLLNGTPGRSIRNARGLRQGDPLSPMLFILVMEVLHRLLATAAQQGVLSSPANCGIHHQCSLYADDVVIFATPRVQDVITIKTVLDFFGQVSGLRTNFHKSQLAPIYCTDEQISRIRDILHAQIATFPIQYLGLPLSVGRLKKSHFQPLIDKVASKIPVTTANLVI
ncbi:uncharacterized protein LOC111256374 [Setaria italica]|uniref:uncharacterized protein LOC111256374 n=1 Tax=Setaria italica TaxID=4555 RepID=UPI000BE53A40|nr:uncharacterized protein LOC111256374 [Setaria italica]